MTGLEDRLRRVQGVADLTVELGEEGLKGIRVRIDEGSDESEVLEEIRRILVAYGLRSRKTSMRAEPIPEIEPDRADGETGVRVSVGPVEDGLEVVLEAAGRRVVARGEATPAGAAEAMAVAASSLRGLDAPDRVALRRVRLDGEPLLVVLVRSGRGVGAGASVVAGSLGDALYRAAASALEAIGE